MLKKIYGFDNIGNEIKNLFFNDKLGACNIFISNEGTGKLSFLKQMSALILSTKKNSNDIEKETEKNFNLIENNSHPDFAILNQNTFLSEKDSDKKIKDEINVAQARNLIEFIQKTSLISKNKVIIIDSIDKTNIEAQNTLLKTLEEPSKNTYIFLICNNKEKVLDTIFSRSCAFYVKKLSFEDWCKGLLDNLEAELTENISENDIEELYVNSNQSIGLAIKIIQNSNLNIYENIIKSFAEKNIVDIQNFCNEIDKNKESFQIFNIIIENFFTDLISYYYNRFNNTCMIKYKNYFELILSKNNEKSIIESYEKIKKILNNIDIYNMSKKHCLNVVFTNYL